MREEGRDEGRREGGRHRLCADFAATAERAEGGEAELDRRRERVARPRVRKRREALRHRRDDRDAVRRLAHRTLASLESGVGSVLGQ